jgi:hypothetical protein
MPLCARYVVQPQTVPRDGDGALEIELVQANLQLPHGHIKWYSTVALRIMEILLAMASIN